MPAIKGRLYTLGFILAFMAVLGALALMHAGTPRERLDLTLLGFAGLAATLLLPGLIADWPRKPRGVIRRRTQEAIGPRAERPEAEALPNLHTAARPEAALQE